MKKLKIASALVLASLVLAAVLASNAIPIKRASATSHHILVDGEETLIEPWISCGDCSEKLEDSPCKTCGTTCDIKVTEKTENSATVLLSYESARNDFETSLTETRLWDYERVASGKTRRAYLSRTDVVIADEKVEVYNLGYSRACSKYKVVIFTSLFASNQQEYDAAYTWIWYKSVEKIEVTSVESVRIVSPSTLSEYFQTLSKVNWEMGGLYINDLGKNLKFNGKAYRHMCMEGLFLSGMIEHQLPEYDRQVLRGSALVKPFMEPPCPVFVPYGEIVTPLCGGGGGPPPSPPPDPEPTCTFDCWLDEFGECFWGWDPWPIPLAAAECLWACMWGSLLCLIAGGPPGYAVCLEACFAVCGIAVSIDLILCAIQAMFYCNCI